MCQRRVKKDKTKCWACGGTRLGASGEIYKPETTRGLCAHCYSKLYWTVFRVRATALALRLMESQTSD